MPRGHGRHRLGPAVGAALGGGVLVFALALLELFVWFPDRPAPGAGRQARVEIPAGIGPKALARLLVGSGVHEDELRLAWWLRLSGAMSAVRVGEVMLDDRLTPREIVGRLGAARGSADLRLTIPEGTDLPRLAGIVSTLGLASAAGFIDAASDRTLLAALGLPGPTAEGYLFPETHFVKPGTTPRAIVELLVGGFRRKAGPLLAALPEKQRHDTVILASIVQAEAADEEEMPRVARVFINRLSSTTFPSRLLQADPTVAYGCIATHLGARAPSCADFSGRLARRHLADGANPYNTYVHAGLPPGPIGNPGRAALRAVLFPAEGLELFFVLSPTTGRHVFSVSLKDHERAVEKLRASGR